MKLLMLLVISVLAIGLVSSENTDVSGVYNKINGTQTNVNLQTQNLGDGTQLQNQVKVQTGSYESANGEQMQIQNENQFRLQVGGVEAKSNMNVSSEYDSIQNKTRLMIQLSNGKNTEIKIMPNTASERALERLRLKVCSFENNCVIELKEVGSDNDKQLAYELQVERHSRIMGLFPAKMQVKAQISAENGEVIRIEKPWWAFIATESAE